MVLEVLTTAIKTRKANERCTNRKERSECIPFVPNYQQFSLKQENPWLKRNFLRLRSKCVFEWLCRIGHKKVQFTFLELTNLQSRSVCKRSSQWTFQQGDGWGGLWILAPHWHIACDFLETESYFLLKIWVLVSWPINRSTTFQWMALHSWVHEQHIAQQLDSTEHENWSGDTNLGGCADVQSEYGKTLERSEGESDHNISYADIKFSKIKILVFKEKSFYSIEVQISNFPFYFPHTCLYYYIDILRKNI